MLKVSLYFSLLLTNLFSFSPVETLHNASKIESSTSVCSRASTTTNAAGLKNGTSSSSSTRLRLELVHRDGPCAPEGSKRQKPLTLVEILAKDQLRVQSIQAKSRLHDHHLNDTNNKEPNQLTVRSGESLGTTDYVVIISLATPPQKVTLVFDTGSDVTWSHCQPCVIGCTKQDGFFDSSASSTYSRIHCLSPLCAEVYKSQGCDNDCTYEVDYDDRSRISGIYSIDKLTLPSGDVFPYFRFGCATFSSGHSSWGTAGILGLDRSPASFVSQTEGRYNKIFAYCIPADKTSTGFLAFGKEEYDNTTGMQFTPFVGSSSSGFYHISITGITIGHARLPISYLVFNIPGAIIDSGTVLTYLPQAYKVMSTEFKRQMNKLYRHMNAPPYDELDTCFYINKNGNVPNISFTFKGGITIPFAPSAGVYYVDSGKVCLAFVGNKKPTDLAIFGNTQQKQLEVLYDVPRNQLGLRINKNCL